MKKLEESVTKGTVDKEPKNVERKIPAQRGDVSIDIKKGKKKRASKEEKKTEKKPKASAKKKELGASKKEEKPTVWKESVLEKTEKRMMPRTKKIAIFSSVIIIISVSLFLSLFKTVDMHVYLVFMWKNRVYKGLIVTKYRFWRGKGLGKKRT